MHRFPFAGAAVGVPFWSEWTTTVTNRVLTVEFSFPLSFSLLQNTVLKSCHFPYFHENYLSPISRAYLREEWFYLTSSFVTKFFSKSFWASISFKNSYQRVQLIHILLKYIHWYEFLSDLDAQSDFDKKIVTKKPVK